MATDLAVTVDDRPGVLADLGAAVGGAGINLDGVSGAAAGAASVVHLLVEDADGARRALEGAGYTSIEQRDVVVIPIENRPGALGELARTIADAGVNLDLIYLATDTRLVLGGPDIEALRAAV
jgi:hypothetical protein